MHIYKLAWGRLRASSIDVWQYGSRLSSRKMRQAPNTMHLNLVCMWIDLYLVVVGTSVPIPSKMHMTKMNWCFF